MPPVSRGLRNILSRSLSYCNSKPALSSLSTRNLIISDEVSQALRNDCPVVSLESTIITHGMPHPTNKEMAVEVEDIIRQCGATPATVAVIEGNIHVGLEPGQLDQLAELKSPAVKTSRRDLAFVTSQGLSGGTTVSGTMLVSHMAGIDVFVTGGVGGVHRGGETSMDVSADLTELGRTPVCVVSAGVKSILDIGLTLEYLETQGVCVAAFSPSKTFPAFYTPDSGHSAPYNVTSHREAAGLVMASRNLGLASGVLIGVPIPGSEAAQGEKIEEAIKVAVEEARAKNITGRDVTPYILARLNELTGGESLKANLALVKNNARVGAGIAVELADIKSRGSSTSVTGEKSDLTASPVVVGGSIYDFVVRLTEGDLSLQGGTHQGSLRSSHGGVGRNVASALTRLGGGRVRFLSAVGRDREGEDILRAAQASGMDTELVLVESEARTATYTAFLDSSGDCKFGVGDMTVHGRVSSDYLQSRQAELAASSLIVCDGNLELSSVHTLLDISHSHQIPFFYEPADLSKAVKPLSSPLHSAMTYCSPNLNELNSMLSTLPSSPGPITELSLANCSEKVSEVAAGARQLISHYGLQVVLVTLSECGVLLVRRGSPRHPLPARGRLAGGPGLSAVWYPCHDPATRVVSVSGAGDCLTAGFISSVLRGLDQATAVSAGMQAAKLSCGVSAAVPDDIHIDWTRSAPGIVMFEEI